MNYMDSYRLGRVLKANPSLMQQMFKNQDRQRQNAYRKEASGLMGDMVGREAVPEETENYSHAEDLFPGEASPFSKMKNITQEAQAATGLQRDVPQQQKFLEYVRQATSSGNPMLMKQGMGMLGKMQDSSMQGYNSLANQRQSGLDAMARKQYEISNKPFKPTAFNRITGDGTEQSGYLDRNQDFVNIGPSGKSSGQTINVGKNSSDMRNKYMTEENINIAKSRMKVEPELRNINTALNLLTKGSPITGFGASFRTTLTSFAKTAGFSDADLQDTEKLQTILGDFVMARVAETKGAVSDKEMELFREYSANMSKSKSGNVAILKFARARMERDIAISNLVRQQYHRKDSADVSAAEINAMVYDYIDTHPIDTSELHDRHTSDNIVPKGGNEAPPPVLDVSREAYEAYKRSR